MQSLDNFIKGIFIGAGAILPGISSGVICISLGIYEKIIHACLHFFQNIYENIKFLLPFGIGCILGIFLFSNLLQCLFSTIPCQTNSLFLGILSGSLFTLAKKNYEKIRLDKWKCILAFCVCFLIGIILIIIEKQFYIYDMYTPNNFSFIYFILCGFLMSIGIVIPGVSSTIILMLLGIYSTYLSALSMVNMHVIFPLLIGIIIGSFFFMQLMQKFMHHFYSITIFSIIGFSLGSLLLLSPQYGFNYESIFGISLLILGFQIGKLI